MHAEYSRGRLLHPRKMALRCPPIPGCATLRASNTRYLRSESEGCRLGPTAAKRPPTRRGGLYLDASVNESFPCDHRGRVADDENLQGPRCCLRQRLRYVPWKTNGPHWRDS